MARRTQTTETFIGSYDTEDAATKAMFRLAKTLERQGYTPRMRLKVKEVKGSYWLVLVTH